MGERDNPKWPGKLDRGSRGPKEEADNLVRRDTEDFEEKGN
jgi:hypothetical protein